MIYVLLRPAADAVMDHKGEAWQSHLRGLEVDPTILPYGGIVLKQIICSNPIITQTIPQVIGYDAKNIAITVERKVPHNRKIIETRKGDSGAPLYVCEPVQYDAEYLSSLRDGWTWQAFMEESHIPRRPKTDTVAEEVAKEAAKAVPQHPASGIGALTALAGK